MRIIAGEYGGRVLLAPKGDMARPTTDRVREALMSTLLSARGAFEGACVLDAFAGSGALGLEALSRGARHIAFCEKQAKVLQTLKANIKALAVASGKATIYQVDSFKFAFPQTTIPFDLVFLDPPYACIPADIAKFLDSLASSALLAENALISYEHAKSSDSAVEAVFDSEQWIKLSRKKYGDISIDLIKYEKTIT